MPPQDFYLAVLKELARAKRKHPAWDQDPVESMGVMLCEAGEAFQAARKFREGAGSLPEVAEEVIQTAAMCLRWMENIGRYQTGRR